MFAGHGCSICAASPAKSPYQREKILIKLVDKKVLKRNLFLLLKSAGAENQFFPTFIQPFSYDLNSQGKTFSTRWFLDYGMITIGSFIMAVGYVYFITPHKIVPGGFMARHHCPLHDQRNRHMARRLPDRSLQLTCKHTINLCRHQNAGRRFGVKPSTASSHPPFLWMELP